MSPPTPAPTSPGSAWVRPATFGGLAVFLLLLNAPVLEHGWVHFDDDINLFLHPRLAGLTRDSIAWAWQDVTYTRRFIPLGWMMFDGLFGLGGLQPSAYHAASWILAAVNAGLLLAVALAWAGRHGRVTPAGTLLAGVTVALAGAHPLLAETVGWASGLLYLASTTWALLAVRLILGSAAPSLSRIALAATCYTASLLTYPVHLALPLVLAAARGWFPPATGREAAGRRILREQGPWLFAALAIGALNLHAAATAGGGHTALAGWAEFGLADRLRQAALTLVSYAGRLVQPGPTAVFYGHHTGPRPGPALATALLLALAVLLGWRRTRRATAGLLLVSGLALAPFLGLIDRQQTASDRYALPLIGLLAVALAARLARGQAGRRSRWAVAAGLATLLSLAVPPYREALAGWHDTDTVQARLEAATREQPNLRLGYTRPALIDFLRGDAASAHRRLAAAEARFGPVADVAATRAEIGRLTEELGRRAPEIRAVPYAVMHLDLAREHRHRGQIQAAEEHALAAERLLRAARAVSAPALPAPAGSSGR